jgi:hypothetical protein
MWVRDKQAHGWKLGPEKTPCGRPTRAWSSTASSPDYQRDKNRLFVAIVRSMTHDMF